MDKYDIMIAQLVSGEFLIFECVAIKSKYYRAKNIYKIEFFKNGKKFKITKSIYTKIIGKYLDINKKNIMFSFDYSDSDINEKFFDKIIGVYKDIIQRKDKK